MKKNNKKGFTLVELVIVVAVMAILVAIAIPTVQSVTKSAKDSVYDSNCQTILSMIKLAEADAAKDGNTDTVSLSASDVQTALTNAKLSIKSATFYYHSDKGTVDGTTGSGAISITYDATGTVTCSAVTGG